MLVCTLLQSRKVLVSVVWATSEAPGFHWARHRPTAAAGRLHTITSRANLVLWHMHVPLPWHMHLCLRMIDRCRVTRPDQPTATRRSIPSPRVRRSARVARFVTPPYYCCYLILTLLATLSPTHHRLWIARTRNTLSYTSNINTATPTGTVHLFPDRSHACISARYTRLYTAFGHLIPILSHNRLTHYKHFTLMYE